MTLETLISAFLNYSKVEKGLSANTIAAYKRDLQKYSAFVEERKLKFDNVSRDDIVDFLSGLYRRKLDSRTVARHLVSVRNLFRFALAEEVISEDPTLNLESPKVRKSLPSYLRGEDVERLLEQPDVSTPVGLRDRAIIEMLYSTGLRVSELAGLRVSDVEMRMGCLHCIGKGDKERLVPVGRKALEAVQQYLSTGRPELLRERRSEGQAPQQLFVSNSGYPIDRITIWRILRTY